MKTYNIDIEELTSYLETHQPRALELTMTEEQLFRQQTHYGQKHILSLI